MLHFTNKKHSRLLKPNAYLAVHDLNIYIRKHKLHKRNIEKKKLLSMAERQGHTVSKTSPLTVAVRIMAMWTN
jgi:hypothetical protein